MKDVMNAAPFCEIQIVQEFPGVLGAVADDLALCVQEQRQLRNREQRPLARDI